MRTIRLEIELTYDAYVMHCGEVDQEAKAWFYKSLLFFQDCFILHSNDIGDEVGEVKILSVCQRRGSREAVASTVHPLVRNSGGDK